MIPAIKSNRSGRPWARHGIDVTIKACGMVEAISRVWFITESQCRVWYTSYRGIPSEPRPIFNSIYYALELRIERPELFWELAEVLKLDHPKTGKESLK